jgi:topoisomerase IA-like protein
VHVRRLRREKRIVANIGRFGPYVLHDKKFISIPKGEDPYTITHPSGAVELIHAKRELDANRLIKAFASATKYRDSSVERPLSDPTSKAGKKNVKIPKGKEPSELTLGRMHNARRQCAGEERSLGSLWWCQEKRQMRMHLKYQQRKLLRKQ